METRPLVGADLPVRPGLGLAACFAFLAIACDSYAYQGQPSGHQAIQSRNIDVGGGLDLDPGRGAGVAVEAHAGGEWRVAATGDVLESGYLVRWDLVVSLQGDGELAIVDDSGLEPEDGIRRIDPGALRMALVTGYGDDAPSLSGGDGGVADGGGSDAGSPSTPTDAGAARGGDLDVVRLRAPEWASLQLDVIMEGVHDAFIDETSTIVPVASFITWWSDGAIRGGAPSNPLIFVPVAP